MLTQDTVLNVLNAAYDSAIQGLPKTKSCYELAENYTKRYETKEKAIDQLIKYQIAKCTTSGFVTNIGGLITTPVAIPANVASVLYMQLRMIVAIAIISGFDPNDDEVQTLTYICLTGSSVAKLLQEAGIKIGENVTLNVIKKIPGTVLTKINQAVGSRIVTKFGTTGIVNLGKMVPVTGGILGASIDFVGTKIIGYQAKKTFLSL